MMVALTPLIDYYCRSYYILLISPSIAFLSVVLLFNISWGCGLVGTAAAFAVSVSIVLYVRFALAGTPFRTFMFI